MCETGVPEDGPVYVHLDCDGLDPSVMPVQFPVPGGLARTRCATCSPALADAGRLVGLEVTAFEYPEHLDVVLGILEPVAGERECCDHLRVRFANIANPDRLGPGSLAVKDLFDTAGVRTTYGSPIFARPRARRRRPRRSRRLEAAGYTIVGKANLHEFAWGITSENDHFGWCRTRSRPAAWPAGRAAAAEPRWPRGWSTYALGTDSGGSIRIPAACCGVVGFKPTCGARAARRLLPAGAELRPRRPDGARRRRLRADDGGAGAGLRAVDVVAGRPAGRRRLDRARRPARARARRGGRRGVLERRSSSRWPDGVYTGFSREIVEVHADLFRDHGPLRPGIATRWDRARRQRRARSQAARRRRELYRERIAALEARPARHADGPDGRAAGRASATSRCASGCS